MGGGMTSLKPGAVRVLHALHNAGPRGATTA
jgi:hypothetical protein